MNQTYLTKKIYLIDFDGTISSKDSFIYFSFFSLPFIHSLKFWVYTTFCYLFKVKNNSQLKESFFLNFKSWEYDEFQRLCNTFGENRMPLSIKKSFLEYIKEVNTNSKIVVVSASIKNYLEPWCCKMGFDLISTELEVVNNKLTGRFSTSNCNGEEKVKRINEKYDLSKYSEIHVFGNSKGDFPMLALGTHKYYKFFK